jgi:hypothetical protein
MTKISSTMLSVGTLLRRAEDTGARVSILVEGNWLGAVLDDADGQALVRLDSVTAVRFQRAQVENGAFAEARAHGGGATGPIEAGPVTVPHPSRGEQHFLTAKPY